MPEPTPVIWIVLILYAFLVAVSKTGIPGVGIFVVVALLFIMQAKDSVGFLLPLLIAGDVVAVAWYRRHAVWRHLIRILPWAGVGLGVGYFALDKVSDGQLQHIIGFIVLALLGMDYWRSKRQSARIPTQWWFAACIGILAGTTTMMANAAGPLVLVYFLSMRLEKHEFMGTGAWFFLIVNVTKVPLCMLRGMITPESLRLNLLLLPAVAAGLLLGLLVFKKLPHKWFVIVVKVLTLAAAVWALVA